ncbi:DNA polymerase alpha subunit B N-terminal-domain-containing protein [Geopyxis carbonaria]|nr:DNA polymerase alpha subunit B N-terminal-domain-containing protein [Geopyxis carbonaria]
MSDTAADPDLTDRFGPQPADITAELSSMLRLYAIDAEELFFKWESYVLSMGSGTGADDIKLSLDSVRAFKKYVQAQFDKEMRSKARMVQSNQAAHRTPRAPRGVKMEGGMDMFDGLATTPLKRKLESSKFGTPQGSKTYRVADPLSSPAPFKTPSKGGAAAPPEAITPFKTRLNAGETVSLLNASIPKAVLPPPEDAPGFEHRITLQFNTELKKFAFRPMYQKLAEAAEVADERIDEFAAALQEHHSLPDDAFGDPSVVCHEPIVAVGRICSDALEGRFNAQSVLLESSRMTGGGARTPLKLDALNSYAFFPGQLVGLRGTNASGSVFAVTQLLDPPPLPPAASSPAALAAIASRLDGRPASLFIAAGPYTTDDNLSFEALSALCDKAAAQKPDVVILLGPFIDSDHPLIAAGDYDLGDDGDDGAAATLDDLFRARIAPLINRISHSLVLLIPSQRDAVSRHPCFPQEPLKRKQLGLAGNVKALPNPSIFSINELVIAASSADVLFHLFRDEISHNPPLANAPNRLTQHILQQRSFYPLFPPPASDSLPVGVGATSLDLPHVRLADLVGVQPDLLILPGSLGAFANVVDGVVAVNPGPLSKRRGAGGYVEVAVGAHPVVGVKTEGQEGPVPNRMFERARVEIVKI